MWPPAAPNIHIYEKVTLWPNYADYHLFVPSGPTFNGVKNLEKLIDRKLSIARLNFSHGTHEVPSMSVALFL